MRISWPEYFMQMAELAAKRSTCLRRQIGAILVRDQKVLATGYNGAPSGLDHCLDIGCIRQQLNIPSGMRHEMCRAVHAEENCMLQAAKHGVAINGATMFCTASPCSMCAKSMVNAGIVKIVYPKANYYPDELAASFLVNMEIVEL